MIILGIDPGLSGALAFIDGDDPMGSLNVIDMPTSEVLRNGKKKREISISELDNCLRRAAPDVAYLELVGAMPGQGVSSMFSFGRSVGIIEALIVSHRVSYTTVSPRVWQRVVDMRKGKDGARLRAQQLFPHYSNLFDRAKDDGRADAALIAYYGYTNTKRTK